MMQRNAARDVLEAQALLEIAKSLDPLERRILLSLRQRGPGLAMEIAVRVYKFPDDIRQPLLNLRDRQLVRSEGFSGSAFGDELISLTARGEQVASLLASGAVPETPPAPAEETSKQAGAREITPAAVLQREAELLQKLGELAAQQGDAKAASDYYRQALDLLRKIGAASSAASGDT
ncbi:MAG: hypothetical protein RMN25_09975 [Anaerolineae bacterium]|nr:hypothetical protein [Thermoflexales bacterium]MDW8408096.1 hypothetical protein [Anaerolineae bacterium]